MMQCYEPFRFYYDQIPGDIDRLIYQCFEEAVLKHRAVCEVPYMPGYSNIRYLRILQLVYNDHPELFYLCPYIAQFDRGNQVYRVRPHYLISMQEAEKKKKELEQKVEEVLGEIFPNGFEGMEDLRKEKYIFDWITRHVTYDQDSLDQLKDDFSNMTDCFNAYGTLVKYTSVCHGISIAFKLLCDRVHLPSIVVSGDAGGRHAWNIVKINGRFYHIDCTWGLKSSINMKNPLRKYQYFNVPDQVMTRNHKPEVDYLPVCHSLRYNPFMQKGLCVRDNEELDQTIERMLLKGQKRFAIMCVNGEPSAEEQKERFTAIARKLGIDFEFYSDLSYIGIVVE